MSNARINELFVTLEKSHAWAAHLNLKSITLGENGEIYSNLLEEAMGEIAQTQKRLVRLFLRIGDIGELLGHIQVGTFTRYAIHAAFNRTPCR